MMKKIAVIFILIVIAYLPAQSAETVYPSGYNLISQYNLNKQTLSPGDTLVITRTIINSESFPLTGLYFSENVPAGFDPIDHNIVKNGVGIDYNFGPIDGLIFDGNICYGWIVDDPAGSVNNTLAAGDELVLTARYTCAAEGSYTFPMHSGVFYGGTTGFYSTDEALTVNVTTSTDTTPPAAIIDLDAP